jgi:hypothetical protein
MPFTSCRLACTKGCSLITSNPATHESTHTWKCSTPKKVVTHSVLPTGRWVFSELQALAHTAARTNLSSAGAPPPRPRDMSTAPTVAATYGISTRRMAWWAGSQSTAHAVWFRLLIARHRCCRARVYCSAAGFAEKLVLRGGLKNGGAAIDMHLCN